MSLNSLELRQVVAELDPGLRGAFLQNVFCPAPTVCYLKLRLVGYSALLHLSVEPGASGLSLAHERRRREGNPPPLQFALRKSLLGSKLKRIELLDGGLKFAFERGEGQRELVASFRSRSIRLAEAGSDASPALLEPEEVGAAAESVSRLQPVAGARFPLAAAAGALLGEKSDFERGEELRKQLSRKLSQKLARLDRTIAKVRQEASRGEGAERHRHFGELLAQNAQSIPRGAKSVELPDYSSADLGRISVPLDPKRRPGEQAAWHFNQYRRFQRAGEIAARRLSQLEQERADLSRRLEETLSAPADGLRPLEQEDGAGSPRNRIGKSKPYREYRTQSGDPIWVGKGAAKNEALTFRVARPHDLWLHARGVSGAHVVVPLSSKQSEISSEALIDAAHLALFHSQAKGEPRGEVSYTRVRNLRRRKGGEPGEVTYSSEKTIMVRVEPERLARLLRSASSFESE